MAAVGFEPTPPKRLVPKTSALDRSATLPIHYNDAWQIQSVVNRPFAFVSYQYDVRSAVTVTDVVACSKGKH